MNKKLYDKTLSVLYFCVIFLLFLCTALFVVLYVDLFNDGFLSYYGGIVKSVGLGLITVLFALVAVFYGQANKIATKTLAVTTICILALLAFMYFSKKYGLLNKFSSIDDFRTYVEGFREYAVPVFILIQFLQVVALPVPSFITVTAGVLMFGPFLGGVYSCVGIIVGSLTAFFIGKILGKKAIEKLLGKDKLQKGLDLVKGKEKVLLVFAFLFPFFPDDLLCFVAGITSVGAVFFTVMIIIVRIITVFLSSYSVNNQIIPYNTWWGILLWIAFFILTAIATKLICKYGDKIELWFLKKFSKNKNKSK